MTARAPVDQGRRNNKRLIALALCLAACTNDSADPASIPLCGPLETRPILYASFDTPGDAIVSGIDADVVTLRFADGTEGSFRSGPLSLEGLTLGDAASVSVEDDGMLSTTEIVTPHFRLLYYRSTAAFGDFRRELYTPAGNATLLPACEFEDDARPPCGPPGMATRFSFDTPIARLQRGGFARDGETEWYFGGGTHYPVRLGDGCVVEAGGGYSAVLRLPLQ